MVWMNFETWKTGETDVHINGVEHQCRYEMGSVVTGKQRVFKEFFAAIILPSGEKVMGTDNYNVRAALYDLSGKLLAENIHLTVLGLSPDFSESGLSHNSGYGYIAGISRSVHMMDNQADVLENSKPITTIMNE